MSLKKLWNCVLWQNAEDKKKEDGEADDDDDDDNDELDDLTAVSDVLVFEVVVESKLVLTWTL